MKIGTKSVLYGAHCFFIHPFFVALAWNRLYGFPKDIRLWVAFFVHDLGYWGKPNMDGVEGESHPILGAKIMHWLFDEKYRGMWSNEMIKSKHWYEFSLYHSRFYAKKNNAQISKLCIADKLAFSMTPKWLYIPMVKITGEVYEYMKDSKYNDMRLNTSDIKSWHQGVHKYMLRYIAKYKSGLVKDTTTPFVRKVINENGVY